jgi:hypothetical protein
VYIGHLAFALAARRLHPAVPLVVLATSTVLADLVDALLQLVGFSEWAGLCTHTLPAVGVWTLAIFALARVLWGRSAAWLISALAMSHVLADGVTSRLLAWPDGPRWGLGLYQSRPADFALESALIVFAWSLYQQGLRRGPVIAMLVLLISLQAIFDFFIELS